METIRLKVWGDYACFTRPEMKVERVSYDVMTPSAARGIIEAILWKPSIRWVIKKIEVLNPIRWVSVRRNEVSDKASVGKDCILIEDKRQQRAGLFLRDVAYLIHANFEIEAGVKDSETPGKFLAMFERRATKGQCFHRPYLGCREFSAQFEFVGKESGAPQPAGENRELGWMLYDLDYSGPEPQPRFFNAKLENGVLNVPHWNSPEVRG
ncbi:MAG: type I-C CRISPR-associated protein Cas5 [Nitrospinae bacterium CG11_big_fil_rev_8_21_14_0_20_56_8]|nr:MAG: type I-C CRISPR-associated protein Cas5 [Nitrospinae bacterium CG11_big_fil_rev_8_21_14_0_20_56_8]